MSTYGAASYGQAYLNKAHTVRKPRFAVYANGERIINAVKVSISTQNNYHADRASITLLVRDINDPHDATWWGQQDTVMIEVKIGFLTSKQDESTDPNSWDQVQTLFKGMVDHPEWHGETGLLILEARDRSAELMDAKTAETFANRTSSEIASILAARHGLTTDIQATDTLAGVYYKGEKTKTSLDSFHKATTEWALLVYLAQREGFDVWVTGDVLHFRPKTPANATPYKIEQSFDENGVRTYNVNSPRFSRDLTKSKDIKVEVKSWSHKEKTAHIYSAGGGSSGSSGGGGKKGTTGAPGVSAQTYVYVIPGLTAAEAQAKANELLKLLTTLERVVSYEEPGNLDYSIRDNVQIVGTGTSWDQRYWIEEITRSLSVQPGEGFRQSVRLRNHDTKSDANVS